MIVIKRFYLLVVGFFIGFSSVFAAPLIPDIYVGSSVSFMQNDASRIINSQIKLESSNVSSNSLDLRLGIRPLDIPILGGFRIEGQYYVNLNSSLVKNKYGVVLYYDLLRFLPIFNVYLGSGVQRSDYKFDTNNSYFSNNTYVFVLGAEANLLIGWTLFAEAKIADDLFDRNNVVTLDSKSLSIGVKKYLLS